MADITNFDIGQGETFKIYTRVFNQSTQRNLDITNYQFTGSLRENYTTTEVAANFNITKIEPQSSGSIFIELTADQTDTLTLRNYVYDVEMRDYSTTPNTVRRILEGSFTVRPGVTR